MRFISYTWRSLLYLPWSPFTLRAFLFSLLSCAHFLKESFSKSSIILKNVKMTILFHRSVLKWWLRLMKRRSFLFYYFYFSCHSFWVILHRAKSSCYKSPPALNSKYAIQNCRPPVIAKTLTSRAHEMEWTTSIHLSYGEFTERASLFKKELGSWKRRCKDRVWVWVWLVSKLWTSAGAPTL